MDVAKSLRLIKKMCIQLNGLNVVGMRRSKKDTYLVTIEVGWNGTNKVNGS